MQLNRLSKGYSLIELLIVIAVICILSAIAYPLYTHHMVQARRNEAKIGLLQLASKLENYASLNNQYSGATLQSLGMPATLDDGSYQFMINSLTDSSYVISANPLGAQADLDVACKSLQLNETGEKSTTGNDSSMQCW